MAEEKPKIIVDDDWKAQAQAEKEKLAEQAEQKTPPSGEPAATGGKPVDATRQRAGQRRELPPPSFTALVSSLATQAMFAMGGMEDPQTHRRYVDLELAKFHIDTLAVLEDKTRGNLTDEEKKLLDEVIYQCRMHYVEIAQRVSQI